MNPKVLYQWRAEIATHLPSLNSWQGANVALFSYGVVLSESSQQMKIARKVACGEQVASAERRLRRFITNDSVAVNDFFKEWTSWIIGSMERKEVVLLVDETKLNDRLAIMVVGLAFEGRCIPLAWRCYHANSKQDYPEEGQVEMIGDLLQQVQAGIPPGLPVLVLADRGIGTSPKLCQKVEALGWDYLFRITRKSKIVCEGATEYTIYDMVAPGEVWQAQGKVFKQRGQIPARALALWSEGYDQPWALVTNAANVSGWEYAQRNWQEQSFRDLKSGGWHWSESRVRCPAHMTRLLLLLVMAYAWVLGIGSYAIHWQRARPLTTRTTGQARRQWSVFKEGLQLFTDYIIRNGVCLKLCFVSDKRLC